MQLGEQRKGGQMVALAFEEFFERARGDTAATELAAVTRFFPQQSDALLLVGGSFESGVDQLDHAWSITLGVSELIETNERKRTSGHAPHRALERRLGLFWLVQAILQQDTSSLPQPRCFGR